MHLSLGIGYLSWIRSCGLEQDPKRSNSKPSSSPLLRTPVADPVEVGVGNLAGGVVGLEDARDAADEPTAAAAHARAGGCLSGTAALPGRIPSLLLLTT